MKSIRQHAEEGGWVQRMERTKNDAQRRMQERVDNFTGDCLHCFDESETTCPHCERGRAQRDAELRAEARQVVAISGLPARFHDHTFETYPGDKKTRKHLEEFCDSWDGQMNLVLAGGYGVGKTGLLAAAMQRVAQRYLGGKKPIVFGSTVGLTDALRAGYTDGTFQDTLNAAKSCRLLVLDDLGSEKATEWVQERLFSIIDDRYGAMKPTWATSNLPPDRLAVQIGERTFWRLIENGQLIQVNGPNLRDRRSA